MFFKCVNILHPHRGVQLGLSVQFSSAFLLLTDLIGSFLNFPQILFHALYVLDSHPRFLHQFRTKQSSIEEPATIVCDAGSDLIIWVKTLWEALPNEDFVQWSDGTLDFQKLVLLIVPLYSVNFFCGFKELVWGHSTQLLEDQTLVLVRRLPGWFGFFLQMLPG